MTRDIKFRALYKKRIFNYVELISYPDGSWHVNGLGVNGSCLFSPSEPPLVMQYSGLKDKNGKEIYEGDIVSFLIHKTHDKGIVVWQDAGFVVDIPKHDWTDISSDMEIIGNIYENPELLISNTPYK